MTCIVGVVDGGQVWIGGDSGASHEDLCISVWEPKVFQNGPMLIGCAGSFRGAQVLRYAHNCYGAPDKFAATGDPATYLVSRFIPNLRGLYDQHGITSAELIPQLLIGLGGHLFEMHDDFSLTESREGFDAIGTGAPYALGALNGSGYDFMDPQTRLKRALEAATRFCPGVRGPFTIEAAQ